MTEKDPLIEIADLAEELCDPTEHIEQIYGWTKARNRKLLRTHKTTRAGLIQQLRQAVYGATAGDQEGRRVIPQSRPPLLLEALGKLIEIEAGVNEWVHIVKIENRGKAELNIRALVGIASEGPPARRHRLLSDLRRWRGWAAVMSGWALPPYQPDVRCPIEDCGELGTLRIILDRKVGLCVACETRWDERDGSINLLAAYINDETEKPRTQVPIGSTTQGHGGWSERRSA